MSPISLIITPTTADLLVGDQLQLVVGPNPHGVKWSCTNCSVASVTSQGLVTALMEGTATITGRRGNQTASVDIVVTTVDPPDPEPPAPPTMRLEVINGGVEGEPTEFSTFGTAAAAGDSIVQSEITFGDGNSIQYPGEPDENPDNTYAAAGPYVAKLTVLTALGATGEIELPLTIVAGPPPPDPEPPQQSPLVDLDFISGIYTNQPVTFTGSTHDPDGVVVSHTKDFGDGTVITEAGPVVSPFTHNYTTAGTRLVKLSATDNNGNIGFAQLSVTVADQPTVNQPPVPILFKLSGALVGDGYVFGTTGTFDPDGNLVSWQFQAGNGIIQSGSGAPPVQLQPVTYSVANTYTAQLTVTDNSGESRTTTLPVQVLAVPPSGNYPYFNSMVNRADRLYAFPCRSQAELDTYRSSGKPPRLPVVYDANMDAMKQTVNALVTGTNKPQQKHMPVVLPGNISSFLLCWDSYYEPAWVWENPGDMDTMKSYRYDRPGGSKPDLWLADKDSFVRGANLGPPGSVAESFVACQPSNWLLPPTTHSGNGERLGPQVPYFKRPGLWTRTWHYQNNIDRLLSVWRADSVQGIIQGVNQTPYAFPDNGVAIFRFEFDTSLVADVTNGEMSVYHHNLFVLQGLSYATVVGSILSTQDL